MKDEYKTREMLIEELQAMRRLNERLEERYVRLVEMSPNAVALHQDGKIIFINNAGAKLVGAQSPEDVVGTSLVDFIHAESKEIALERIQAMYEHGASVPKIEEKFVKLDGTVIDVEVSASSLSSKGDRIAMVVVHDITKRKRTEQLLKDERKRLYSLLDSLPVHIYLQAQDHSIAFANKKFKELYGEHKGKLCYQLKGRTEPCEDCETFKVFEIRQLMHRQRTAPNGKIYDLYSIPFSDIDGTPLVLEFGIDITERKLAEEKLIAERQRLYSVLDAIPGIVYLQAPDYRISFANKMFQEVFGKPGDKLCYQVLRQRNTPCDDCPTFEILRTKQSRRFERLNPNGRVYDLIDYPFQDVDGSPLVLELGIDITERKQAEQALQISEARYRTLFETMKQGVIYLDNEGWAIAANPAAVDMLGLTEEEMYNKTAYDADWDILNEDGTKALATAFPGVRCLYSGNEIKNVVLGCFNPREGRYRWLNINAIPQFKDGETQPYQVYITLEDITERKMAEEKLKVSEERLSKTFNATPALLGINKLSNGSFVEVNEYFLKVTGYQREEVIGRTPLEFKLLSEVGFINLYDLIRKQKSIRNQEMRIYDKWGKMIETLSSIEIIDINGEPHALIIANDVTELNKLELEMARLDRLKVIGEMAAGIGHEIRNPMTTVRGLLQVLSAREGCAAHRHHFEIMIDELDRANSIITEYLSLARVSPPELKLQDLDTIIESIYPLMQADAFESNKYVEIDLAKVPQLNLNGKEMRQLILNLVRNALEAMDRGGRVEIKTYQDNNHVVMAIKDQGNGIKDEILTKLGTPFFTTKTEGTGLGLAICYSIASRHNAEISIQSSSEGTIFYVHFKIP